MFWRFALFFVGFSLLELFILFVMMNWAGLFGIITTALLIFGGSLFGACLVRYQGINCWLEAHRQLDRGEMPTRPAADGVLILIAGVLLATPGLITDLLGILLLFPPFRGMVIAYTLFRFEVYRLKTRQKTATPPQDDIIDV